MIASDRSTTLRATPGLHDGTLVALLERALLPDRAGAFAERLGGETWHETSSREMLARARAISAALHGRGLVAGDRVAVVGENSVGWIAAAFGTLAAAATLVPVFKTLADDQLGYILDDAAVRFAFAEDDAVAARIRALRPELPLAVMGRSGTGSLATFEGEAAASHVAAAAAARSRLTPDDLALLIYTSGTTGLPKGVALPHGSLLSNAVATHAFLFDGGIDPSPTMHVLPFAHVMALSGVLTGLLNGVRQVVTRPEYLMADLLATRPRTLALVPRLLERLVAGMQAFLARDEAARTQLHAPALETARRFADAALAGDVPSELAAEHDLAERLVYGRIRAMFGLDRIELLGTGSAAMHPDVARIFYGIGLPLSEGYGMTEAGPAVTIARRGELRFGSVGRAIDGVRIRTAEDGEIEVASPGLMRGYLGRDDAEPFTADGWYKTGDVGRIDADGFLWLTDRKKEIFKTTTGKFVAPARVEAAIQRSVFIDQATVVGDGRPFPVALVSPSWPLVRASLGLEASLPQAEAAERADVLELVEREIASATTDLAPFERVRRAAVLAREFSIEGGELSPSMKTKRRVVETRYADAIAAVYARAEAEAS